MSFDQRLIMPDGSFIFSAEYQIGVESFVKFWGSKTGTHRVYFPRGVRTREDNLRVSAHWEGYAEAARRAARREAEVSS